MKRALLLVFLLASMAVPACGGKKMLVRRKTLPVPPPQVNYYVNPTTGSDDNAGTSAGAAWASMAKVAVATETGHIINIDNANDAICSADWPAGRTYQSDQLTQYGITWTFNQAYTVGKYVNGDFWVVGPIQITAFSPACAVVNSPIQNGGTFTGRVVNGSMLNPAPANYTGSPAWQGLDSAVGTINPASTPHYSAALNVAAGVDAGHPLAIAVNVIPIRSLLSCISRTEVYTSVGRERLSDAAILTVVASAPAADAFRPPYCGDSKPYTTLAFTDVNTAPLQNLAPVEGVVPLSTCEAWVKRPYLEFAPRYPSSGIRPENNQSYYPRQTARRIGYAALNLNLNYTQAQKKNLLVYLLQQGIDLQGIVAAGGIRLWYAAGDVSAGHKLPMFYAALLLDDANMQAVMAKSGDYIWDGDFGPPTCPSKTLTWPLDYIQLGNEDGQVFYVAQNDVDWTNSAAWSPDARNGTPSPYVVGDIGLPEWGTRWSEMPWTSDKALYAIYRQIASCTMPATALAVLMVGGKTLWNQDAFFDYADRVVYLINTSAVSSGWRYGSNGMDDMSSYRMAWNMWAAYRASYGAVWTP